MTIETTPGAPAQDTDSSDPDARLAAEMDAVRADPAGMAAARALMADSRKRGGAMPLDVAVSYVAAERAGHCGPECWGFGYVCGDCEAIRRRRGNPARVERGSGVIVAFDVNPENCNGYSWCAHVDRYRRFDGVLVEDVSFPYSRFGHSPEQAYETCLKAIRRDAGPTYRCFNWRLEKAPEHAV